MEKSQAKTKTMRKMRTVCYYLFSENTNTNTNTVDKDHGKDVDCVLLLVFSFFAKNVLLLLVGQQVIMVKEGLAWLGRDGQCKV